MGQRYDIGATGASNVGADRPPVADADSLCDDELVTNPGAVHLSSNDDISLAGEPTPMYGVWFDALDEMPVAIRPVAH